MTPEEAIDAVAKCDSNDDVLYLAGNEDGVEVYYIFHLTYSKENAIGATPENPLERYDYWKKCRYAYCSFRELNR